MTITPFSTKETVWYILNNAQNDTPTWVACNLLGGDSSSNPLLIPWLGTISSMDNIRWGRTGIGNVTTGPNGHGGLFINWRTGVQVVFDFLNKINLRNSAAGTWTEWRAI